MESVDSIIEITNQMELTLKNVSHKTREEVIEQLNNLLDKREELLATLKKESLSDEEKAKVTHIISKNEKITKEMVLLKKAVQQDLLQTKKGKSAFNGYHQFDTPSIQDGYYIDRKK